MTLGLVDPSDQLVVLDGSTFLVSRTSGDIAGSPEEPEGFFHADTRHLSRWQLTVDGRAMAPLTVETIGSQWARIFVIPPGRRPGRPPEYSLLRNRRVSGSGLHEDLVLENHRDRPREVELEVRFASDFADIFEVRGWGRRRRVVESELGEGSVTLTYRTERFSRLTHLGFIGPDHLDEDRAVFRARLDPGGRWRTCLTVSFGEGAPPACPSEGPPETVLPRTYQEWLADAPGLDTDHDALAHTFTRSLEDLAALRFRPFPGRPWSVPAAGLPWFMTLFGRDSLIAAYQTLHIQPELARSTLLALAEAQAEEDDDFRDAEPGKILHEMRRGELAATGAVPHSAYYGTHDATALFLVLLDEYHRWTRDVDLVETLEGAARSALGWIARHGDLDGDGYLEYRTRSPRGLGNQCWKDSRNSILFADGRQAQGPLAVCEIQGYAYDARLRAARLAREVWRDEELAGRLEEEGARLKDRFNRDFWSEERGHYVLALDGGKRPVDSMTSNAGHLLWSGIVDERRAEAVVERLMAPDMFSGWGVRTMSSVDAGYHPFEYHDGTVWPHDTAFVAEGMRRYGFREEASLLVRSLVEAAEHFAYRLPELFSGLARESTGVPVAYPDANRPQAWAAGAPLLGIRTLLGLDPEGDGVRCDPRLPAGIGRLRLEGVPGSGGLVDLP